MLNIANMRTRHARHTLEALRERFGDAVCESVIRESIVYAESAERALPILEYRPKRGVDYLDLGAELLGRLGWEEQAEALREQREEIVPRPVEPTPEVEAETPQEVR